MKPTLVFIAALFFTVSIANAQNAKKYFKTAEDFLENKQLNDALDLYTKAIDLDPDYTEAYIQRAKTYELTGEFGKAALDFDRAITFEPKDDELIFLAARAYYNDGNYDMAITRSQESIAIRERNLPATQIIALSLLKKGSYYEAIKVSEQAKELKDNSYNHYIHGLISEKLNNLVGAENDFKNAISRNSTFMPAYISLAQVQLGLNKPQEAFKNISQVFENNAENVEAYIVRSQVHKKMMDYPKAINDISNALILKPNDASLMVMRGKIYQEFTQHNNAINDFNAVLLKEPGHAEALYSRARSFESTANFSAAIKDYKKLSELTDDDPSVRKMLAEAQARLFELNKESNKPEVVLIDPKPVNKYVIETPRDKAELSLKGFIKDESEITFLKINDKDVQVNKTENGYEFQSSVYLGNSEIFSVTTGDVYNNVTSNTFTIKRTEINPPDVAILAPYASDNQEIYLADNNPSLYIEGKIGDESLIGTILIEGMAASYRPEDINPVFSATINIANKNKFTVQVIDQYGNENIKEFKLNRETADILSSNPMGKTWVIFIENSNYENFASLEGPKKDVSLMKSTFANYKIHNIIHKTDLGKRDLERFFSIELRDLVRSNRVNSLLVWYAGHGKFINETGYWIPVDAERDDEFTYYNINALKGSLQAYSNYITHTLVVTDACESGPTFYQAMRSTGEKKDCNDWQATRFKSSQVFSSAGYELALDNSQFTKTFSASLNNNPNACIAIDEVVHLVSEAVEKNNQQRPLFGKIQGMVDENGTFFFIQKDE